MEKALAMLGKHLRRVFLRFGEWLRLEALSQTLHVRVPAPRVDIDLASQHALPSSSSKTGLADTPPDHLPEQFVRQFVRSVSAVHQPASGKLRTGISPDGDPPLELLRKRLESDVIR